MDKEKEKCVDEGGGLPPPSSSSSSFSHEDISRMADNPRRDRGHRRAHSEILTLPDDIRFDSELGVVEPGDGDGDADGDGPSFDDDLLSIYLDMGKLNSSSALPPDNRRSHSHSHSHSHSMDASSTMKPHLLLSPSSSPHSNKPMSPANLADLALIDPKRAKRIWANRQSAARSKERKMRYIAELERKVHTLKTQATSLSAQFSLFQRDTNGLNSENNELKLRLQSMEQQVHLQDALNDALKEEIQHLKILTGQPMSPNGGPVMNFPSFGGAQAQQFYPNNHAMNTLLAAQQFQQLQIHPQKQQHQFQQLQQQQMLQQQRVQQQREHHHQQSSDLKMREATPTPCPKDNASSDVNPSGAKDC